MEQPLPRSPLLMSRDDTAVLVVDMQTKLLNLIEDASRLTWNVGRLLDAAKALGVASVATEQYPQGLGPTEPSIANRLQEIPAKTQFSCAECGELFLALREQEISKLLVCGIETHVCVQQTVLDLLTNGFDVYLAVDAVAARFPIDHETGLRRMELSGAILTTTESAMFEWCERSGTPEFKQISALVKSTP